MGYISNCCYSQLNTKAIQLTLKPRTPDNNKYHNLKLFHIENFNAIS